MSITPLLLRDMKAMIEREVLRRHIEDDIKLGAGGIREIELLFRYFNLFMAGLNVSYKTVNV